MKVDQTDFDFDLSSPLFLAKQSYAPCVQGVGNGHNPVNKSGTQCRIELCSTAQGTHPTRLINENSFASRGQLEGFLTIVLRAALHRARILGLVHVTFALPRHSRAPRYSSPRLFARASNHALCSLPQLGCQSYRSNPMHATDPLIYPFMSQGSKAPLSQSRNKYTQHC